MTMADPLLPHESRFLLVDWDVSQFREMIHTDPSAEAVRWWRALPNPGIDPLSGSLPWGVSDQKWIREEQTTAAPYMALVQVPDARTRYLPQGVLRDGDIVITSMPDELPIAEHDWVCPIGKPVQSKYSAVTGRTLTYKALITRARATITLSGAVSSNGVTVTGSGTEFLSQIVAGDVVVALGQARIVTAVMSDTSLTVDVAPDPVWSGVAFSRGVDRFIHWPAASVDDVRSASSTFSETAYRIDSGGQELRWLSLDAPLPGETYSVSWRYYPIYQVIGDAGISRRNVQGVPLPQRFMARLLTQIRLDV